MTTTALHVLYIYEMPTLELVRERARPLSSVDEPSFGRSHVLMCPAKRSCQHSPNTDPHRGSLSVRMKFCASQQKHNALGERVLHDGGCSCPSATAAANKPYRIILGQKRAREVGRENFKTMSAD